MGDLLVISLQDKKYNLPCWYRTSSGRSQVLQLLRLILKNSHKNPLFNATSGSNLQTSCSKYSPFRPLETSVCRNPILDPGSCSYARFRRRSGAIRTNHGAHKDRANANIICVPENTSSDPFQAHVHQCTDRRSWRNRARCNCPSGL